MKRGWWLVVLVVSVWWAGVARADGSSADTKAALAAYKSGMAHYRLQEYDAAVDAWNESFRLKAAPETLYNLGQAYRLAGKPEKALGAYRNYLSMLPDAKNRPEVEKWIAVLQPVIEQRARAAEAAKPVPPPVVVVEPAPAPVVTAEIVVRPPEKKPVYKKAWFWGVVTTGVVVVAAGVALGVVFGTRSSGRSVPDVRFP